MTDSSAEERLAAMIDDLDITITPTHVTVALLSDHQLMSRFSKITQQLLERGETLAPTTDTGKDLHSERDAYLVELSRRKLR